MTDRPWDFVFDRWRLKAAKGSGLSTMDHAHAESLARRAGRPFSSIFEHDLEELIEVYLARGRTETAMICRKALDAARRNRTHAIDRDGETSRASEEGK